MGIGCQLCSACLAMAEEAVIGKGHSSSLFSAGCSGVGSGKKVDSHSQFWPAA